jgi:hypothetical protein
MATFASGNAVLTADGETNTGELDPSDSNVDTDMWMQVGLVYYAAAATLGSTPRSFPMRASLRPARPGPFTSGTDPYQGHEIC